MGVLGWSPQEFWAATMHDIVAAIDGWRIAHGIPDERLERKNKAAELKNLKQRLDDFVKRQQVKQ